MARKSSIEKLPEDILATLQALLLDPRITQLQVTHEINALLVEQGEPTISKSAVGRYAITFEELTAEAVETERVSELMIKELKINNQSAVGQATAEMLRVMLFRVMPVLKSAMTGELDLTALKDVTGMINTLATSHEKLERSATENEKRKRDIERHTKEEAAAMIGDAVKKAGLSDEDWAAIRANFLGVEVQV